MLVLCITLSMSGTVVFAKTEVEASNIISQDDAAKIVLLFISNTIKEDANTNWNKDTKLKSIDETFDLNGKVNSYCFVFENNNEPNGYVVVSADTDLGIILEYSDSAEPIYKQVSGAYDKILYTGPLEYYLSSGKDVFEIKSDKKNQKELRKIEKKNLKDNFNRNRSDKENNKHVAKTIKEAFVEDAKGMLLGSTYTGQVSGYAVNSDVYGYVNSRYGSGWTLKTTKTVSSVGSALLMNNFRPGVGCCTITALTYVFDYHRRNSGKTKIPSNIQTLFTDIENVAVTHGYNKTTGGTNPLKINNIINDVWKKYGYTGSGTSVYVFTQSDFTTEINNNRPALLNITFGYYGNHSVSMVGYRIYSGSTWLGSSERLFLKVYDGWTTADRFIDYEAITNPTSGDFSTLSISKVRP